MSGTFAAIFSFEASKKWIIRDGGNGISVTGSGAPSASGSKKSLGFRIGREGYMPAAGPGPCELDRLCGIGVHLEVRRKPVPDPPDVRERDLHVDLASQSAKRHPQQDEDPATPERPDLVGNELHPLERVRRGGVPLAHAVVATEHAGDRGIERVAPLDRGIEQRHHALEPVAREGLVSPPQQLDVLPLGHVPDYPLDPNPISESKVGTSTWP
jgi:hypothetical protein